MTEPPEQTPSKRRVIVVDDEQVIANTLAVILNQAGFEARAVFSGEQAIKLLESFQPEMLIADVVMPSMTGIEAAIAIRNKLPTCNILLFSGQAATTELLEQARKQGHEFEIVAKPVHPFDLPGRSRTDELYGCLRRCGKLRLGSAVVRVVDATPYRNHLSLSGECGTPEYGMSRRSR